MFKGVYTALVTPFTEDGKVDFAGMERLLDFQMRGGISGVVVMGTTGENPTLSPKEKEDVIRHVVEYVAGRVKVIVGTGNNATESTIEQTKYAEKCKADGALVVVPYYNKPSAEGQFQHFKHVAESTSLPLLLYNVPGRTVTDLSLDVVERLASFDNIVGIKDATGDMARPMLLRQRLGGEFIQLSGDDISFSGFLAQGGHGIISVSSNIIPKIMMDLYQAWIDGDVSDMLACADEASLWGDALFWECNPVPVKYVLSLMGICSKTVRLPLVDLSKEVRSRIDKVYQDAIQSGMMPSSV